MEWKNVANSILSFAPGIATAIGGPVGAAASLGVKALCGVFGLGDDATPEQAASVINNMTPELAIKLKQTENEFVVQMKKLDVDVFNLEVEDRANARDREKSVGSFDTRMLAIAFVLLFIVVVVGIIFFDTLNEISSVKLSIVSMLLGGLISKVNTIIEYFFGGSKGGDEVTAKMASQIQKAGSV